VRCLAAQARGDFDQAFRDISVLAVPVTFISNLPLALGASFDFVECAVRTGHQMRAREYVAMTQTAELAAFSPRLRLLSESAAALVDARATDLLQRLLSGPDGGSWPYDRARVQLACAERLRRAGSLSNARRHLTEARATFMDLGVEPLVSRTSRELRIGVQPPAGATPSYGLTLTSQEREIADLAASGLTNKQIAARIYLSHRTVGAHLYRIFPKLGVTTRAALRDALSDSR
jgi:DNA-binding CsgD family transcriptional regulator